METELSSKKYYDEESQKMQRSSSRRTSIFDVFALRRKPTTLLEGKENAGEPRSAGAALKAIEEVAPRFSGSDSAFTGSRNPVRKAKRILGIESPVKRFRNELDDERRLRPVDKAAQRAATVTPARDVLPRMFPLAPLASPASSLENLSVSPKKRFKDGESNDDALRCPQTPIKRSACAYSKLTASCARLVRGSPLGSIGRSISTIPSPSLLSLRSRVPSASSLRTPSTKRRQSPLADAPQDEADSSQFVAGPSHGTPLRVFGGSTLSRVANAVMKGIATAPRVSKPNSRVRPPRDKGEIARRPRDKKPSAHNRSFLSGRQLAQHALVDVGATARQRETNSSSSRACSPWMQFADESDSREVSESLRQLELRCNEGVGFLLSFRMNGFLDKLAQKNHRG